MKNIKDLGINPFLEESEEEEINSVLLNPSNVFKTVFSEVELSGIKIFYLLIKKAQLVGANEEIWISYDELSSIGFGNGQIRFLIIDRVLKSMSNVYLRTFGEEQWEEYGVIQNRYIHKKRSRKFALFVHPRLIDEFVMFHEEQGFSLDFSLFSYIKTKAELKILEVVTSFMVGERVGTIYLDKRQIKNLTYFEGEIPPSKLIKLYLLPPLERVHGFSEFSLSCENIKIKSGSVVGVKIEVLRKNF